MPEPIDPALEAIAARSEIPLDRLRALMERLKAGESVTPDDLSLVISTLGAQRNLLEALVALTRRNEHP